jgi:hypothetical protein
VDQEKASAESKVENHHTMTAFMNKEQISNQRWHCGIRGRTCEARYDASSQKAFETMSEETPDICPDQKKEGSQIYRSFTDDA